MRDFEHAQRAFLRGDLLAAQGEAGRACQRYSRQDPASSWKFRILEARVLAWRGMYEDVLEVLAPELPASLQGFDYALQKQILQSAAKVHLHRYQEAQAQLQEAEKNCEASNSATCGELLNVQGLFRVEQGKYGEARPFYERSLHIARFSGDPFAEASALLKLSQVELLEEHFDEAIDRSEEAYQAADRAHALVIKNGAQGNLGWALYKTGDPDKALDLFGGAEKGAHDLGAKADEVRWLTTSGYVYLDQGNFPVAEDLYRKSLDLATRINSKEDILNAQISLAFVSVLTGKLGAARQYSDLAIGSARADGNRVDELYPLLTKGQIVARQGDSKQAEQIFTEVAGDPKVDPSLKWEAQHELANLYASQRQTYQALAAYRTTIKTFETARSEIQHEDVKLPFLSNASSLYDDYVSFLLSNGKVAEALSVADHARARTLAEGLGQLSKTDPALPSPINTQLVARKTGGSILYYSLGPKQSYLWAITPQKTRLFPLPPASQIDAAVHRYRKALETPRDPLSSQNTDGVDLYRMLVEPAAGLVQSSRRIFVIPDGSLNALNFEALIVPDPKPHYWIEDVTIADASSLRLLEHSQRNARANKPTLLLVGNPLAAGSEYGTLPQAASEMADVGRRFPAQQQRVLGQSEATPAAYLAANPERYGYIHFVAHGTASRLSPLDSAIVLSRSSTENDSYKLYARDIIQRPLRAELVTISSCYGAGSRAYSGEGLVGLSWAFLRAGAHNVIGALWDVSDASTPRLMDEMYAAIQSGKPPDEALRAAKLSLLHSRDSFSRPFYWAPFQLYTGS